MSGNCDGGCHRNRSDGMGSLQEQTKARCGAVRIGQRSYLCCADGEFSDSGWDIRALAGWGPGFGTSGNPLRRAGHGAGAGGAGLGFLRWWAFGFGSECREHGASRSRGRRMDGQSSTRELASVSGAAGVCRMAFGSFGRSRVLRRTRTQRDDCFFSFCSSHAGNPCGDRDRGGLDHSSCVFSFARI